MDGKTQAWRDAADNLLATLAVSNQYIVADMVIIFLESAGYGLDNYTSLGGVFKRAAKRGIIKKIPRHTKQALWASNVFNGNDPAKPVSNTPVLFQGQRIGLQGFGKADGDYRITNADGGKLSLEAVT